MTVIEGKAENLAADIGSFDVVTIGRALHWMDHSALGPVFARLKRNSKPGPPVRCHHSHSMPWAGSERTSRNCVGVWSYCIFLRLGANRAAPN